MTTPRSFLALSSSLRAKEARACSGELHITSLVVHSTPERVQGVSHVIASITGAKVHATSPNGKLVVTLEASTADEMVAKITGIQRADGVLSAALVYQYVDSLDAMNEELPDASC